jgi:hypothetical protein
MNDQPSPWPVEIRLGEVRGFTAEHPLRRQLQADEAARAAITQALDLESLDELRADLDLSAWFDGVRIDGRWRASITQICGVSLEPFATGLEGEFVVHAVPAGSPHAPSLEREVVIDPLADDPPDVLDGDLVGLGGYVVEHLALEIDPFPRRPGAEFAPPESPAERSPFSVLEGLKRTDPKQ